MYYAALWNDTIIGISDSMKDIKFYVYDIRGLNEYECTIQIIDDETIDFYKQTLLERELYLVYHDGVPLPQMIVRIINEDFSRWPLNTKCLLNMLVSFSKIMLNSKTISDSEDKESLLKTVELVAKISSDSHEIFATIEDEYFFSHPVLTCNFEDYMEYVKMYDMYREVDTFYKYYKDKPYT